MKLCAVIPALVVFAACIDSGTGVLAPKKCVDVPASSDVRTWTVDRDDNQPVLTAVWGAAGTNAFAVGRGGAILHYDGTAWRAESSGTDIDLHDVWGTAANNVFAVGGKYGFNTGAYYGVILHYDGTAWSNQLMPSAVLDAVWGSSPTDVYVVGSRGTTLLLHYDGATWAEPAGALSPQVLRIWGLSPSDIYAVGSQDTIWHYDGNRWTGQKVAWSGTPGLNFSSLSSAWGSAATNIFAVGTRSVCSLQPCEHAVVARYCGGGSWTGEELREVGFNAVWGSSANDIYVVGDSGMIFRRDGTGWVRQPRLTAQALSDVWGTPDGVLFAVGGGVILRGTR